MADFYRRGSDWPPQLERDCTLTAHWYEERAREAETRERTEERRQREKESRPTGWSAL